MAITTYAELQTAAANWLVRSDLTARVPEFITLAEARINRILRARLAEVDQALTGTVSVRTIALPATFAEALQLWIVRDGRRDELPYEDPSLLEADTSVNGEPRTWTIDGANVAFDRPLDQAYSFVLRMLKKFSLSDAAPTNSLLSEAPDVYLFATLSEAAPFLRDAELASAYETKLGRAVTELNVKDARSRGLRTLTTELPALTRAGSGYDITRDA